MFEIIIAAIIIICIIYIFRGDFSKKEVGVTVLKSLPLSIFKKWSREDKSINKRYMKKDMSEDIEDIDNNINDYNNEVLEEIAIGSISAEVEEAENKELSKGIEECIVSEGIEETEVDILYDEFEEIENSITSSNETEAVDIVNEIEAITEINEVENRNEYLSETEEMINNYEIDEFSNSQENLENNRSMEIQNKLESIDLEVINNEEEIKEVVEEFNNTMENILVDDVKDISDVFIDDISKVIENKEIIDELKEKEIVYWTPNGKTYHVKNTCRTLARSKVINSGTIYESGKDFKCEHCK